MEEKKGISLPIKVIIIGCIIGVVVSGFGGIKQINAKKINEERRQAALKQSQEEVDAANKRLAEINPELESLNKQYDDKNKECDSLNMRASDWFEKVNQCHREASAIKSKINDLESEIFNIKNGDYTVYYQLVKPMSYQMFYIIGASIAGTAILGAFIIYLVKGKKNY